MCCDYTGSGLNDPALKAVNKATHGTIAHSTVHDLADIACNAIEWAAGNFELVNGCTDWKAAYTILPTNNATTLLSIIEFVGDDGSLLYALFWSEWFGKGDVGYKWEPFSRVFFERAHSRLQADMAAATGAAPRGKVAGHHTDDYYFCTTPELFSKAVRDLTDDTVAAGLPLGIESAKTRADPIAKVYGIVIDLQKRIATTSPSVLAKFFHLTFTVLAAHPRPNDRVDPVHIEALHGVLAFMKPTCQAVAPLSYPLNGALRNRSTKSRWAHWTHGAIHSLWALRSLAMAILLDSRLLQRSLECLRRSTLPPQIGIDTEAALDSWWANEAKNADVTLWADASLTLRTVATVCISGGPAGALKDGTQMTRAVESWTQTVIPPDLFAPHEDSCALSINVLELLCFPLALSHASTILHARHGADIVGKRVFIWGDSRVAKAWFDANRSDTFSTSALLSLITQMQITSGVRATTGWVKSADNPSDRPSRHMAFSVAAPPASQPPLVHSLLSQEQRRSRVSATLPAQWAHTVARRTPTSASAEMC